MNREAFVVSSVRTAVGKAKRGSLRNTRPEEMGAHADSSGSKMSIFIDNLPGYPDNLMRGSDGRIWLGFAKPRSKIVDMLADKPLIRKMILRLPRFLWPVPKAYGHAENHLILLELHR